jgi:hypothetical protein
MVECHSCGPNMIDFGHFRTYVCVWQADGGLWVLSEPISGMTDLLGHAAGQT